MKNKALKNFHSAMLLILGVVSQIFCELIAYLDFSLNKKLFHQFPIPFSEAGVMDGYAKGKSELEIGVSYLTCQLFQLKQNIKIIHNIITITITLSHS